MQLHSTPYWGAPSMTSEDNRQRKFEIGAWNAHCSQLIAAEIERRGLTARNLTALGVIRTRPGFRKRLEERALWSGELADLLAFFEIDLFHAMTTFLAREPLHAYSSGVFKNFTRIMAALVEQYEAQEQQHLEHMDPLRPAVVESMASKIIDQLASHQSRIDSARNYLGTTVRA